MKIMKKGSTKPDRGQFTLTGGGWLEVERVDKVAELQNIIFFTFCTICIIWYNLVQFCTVTPNQITLFSFFNKFYNLTGGIEWISVSFYTDFSAKSRTFCISHWWKAVGWKWCWQNIICQHPLHRKSFQKKKIQISRIDSILKEHIETACHDDDCSWLQAKAPLRFEFGSLSSTQRKL